MPLSYEQATGSWRSYRPTDKTALAHLGEAELYPLVGASGVGKDYNMRLLETTGLAHIVPSWTTRDPRPGDVSARHVSTEEALELIEEGKVVQYFPVFGNGSLYFTKPEDFHPGPNVKDVSYDALDTFDDRELKKIRAIGVLAPAEQFAGNLIDRVRALGPDDAAKRLAHAAITTSTIMQWCQDTERLVIVSKADNNADNLMAMRRYMATGEVDAHHNQAAAMFGARMLYVIQKLQRIHDTHGSLERVSADA